MKDTCCKIIATNLIFIFLLGTNISIAVSQSEINAQKNQQSQINSQINDIENQKNEVEAKKSETMKQVESLSTQIDGYESKISDLNSQISDANAKIEEAEQKIEENQAEYDRKEELLKQRLIAVYESGETSYLDFLLTSKSLIDFISNYYLVSEVAEMDKEIMENLEKQKAEIEESKKQIEESKQTLEEAKASQEVVANQLKSAKAEKDKYVSELSEEERALENKIQELREANNRIANEIRQAEILYAQQISALNGGEYTPPPAGEGFLSRPISGGYITAQGYYSSGKFHGAIDYGVPTGTPVYAAADGVVMSTANLTTSYGTYVVIRHANGLQTYYCHGTRGSICVSPGETVSRGEQIMLSGNTGNSTGPHLHFEVRVAPYSYNGYATGYGQDSRVNPLSYM